MPNSGLMIKDDMANLGLGDVGQSHAAAGIPVQNPTDTGTSHGSHTSTTSTNTSMDTTDQIQERI